LTVRFADVVAVARCTAFAIAVSVAKGIAL
jgi:hypothetical protein